MIHTEEIPAGLRIEWRPDHEWEVLTVDRPCSFRRCGNKAVATLRRTRRLASGDVTVRCNYCAEHMYGREIRDGVVMVDCLVPAEAQL